MCLFGSLRKGCVSCRKGVDVCPGLLGISRPREKAFAVKKAVAVVSNVHTVGHGTHDVRRDVR